MAYSLKSVWFKDRNKKILLQNENGPCPLLAAANVLLLSSKITLPESSIRNNVASIDDVVNMLAGHALRRNEQRTETITNVSEGDDHAGAEEAAHHINELLTLFPSLQHGMDVNPKFTLGPTGCEYTNGLGAFDIMGVDLVHGWLVDIEQEQEVAKVIGSKSYNELVEMVIRGNEATELREKLAKEITRLLSDDDEKITEEEGQNKEEEEDEEKSEILGPYDTDDQSQIDKEKQLDTKQQELQKHTDIADQGSLVKQFLDSTSHQLTYAGLTELHGHVKEGSLCVFFRNNHFATLTKHEGTLYLLVTDLGYARVQDVIWEKLDDISGDTDLYDSHFSKTPVQSIHPSSAGPNLSPEQLLAQRGQSEADYRLALELSRNDQANPTNTLAEREGDLIAAATELSLLEYNNTSPTETPGGVEEPKQNEESLYAIQMRANEQRDLEVAMRLQAELNAAENSTAQQTTTSAPRSTSNAQTNGVHAVEELEEEDEAEIQTRLVVLFANAFG
eukprot:CAMPEP_0203664732 /NCGR_PEP_ID=MMETSP0090-20130426/2085_1 /ASSEMBLY_ACC=CAM_ASM_001088 /TAXON_ID=426623 /ORGANISM="Chaetoceros affinis, Strain CCMP159" /LENGTH=504 /DNA_ID=CAMNT_0050528073 /DNA_START=78 /DNA_END=1593 /DNA_ORIENTATION=-